MILKQISQLLWALKKKWDKLFNVVPYPEVSNLQGQRIAPSGSGGSRGSCFFHVAGSSISPAFTRRSVRAIRPEPTQTEGAVYVACSTLCFARHPLERALRIIGELEFSKLDVAIHESGPHLRPSEVARDVPLAAQRIRIGPVELGTLPPGKARPISEFERAVIAHAMQPGGRHD